MPCYGGSKPHPTAPGRAAGGGSFPARLCQEQSLALGGCACAGGSCAPAPQHGEVRVGTGSCWVAAPGSVRAASWRHGAPLLCWHCTQGGSRDLRSSAGCWQWRGGVWGPSRCCPSAACSRRGAGSLQAAFSPPHPVPLAPARGRGLLSLLSPRDGTHTPGGQSRSARLCRLWVCSESPAARLFPGLQAPGSHPQAPWALLPGPSSPSGGTMARARLSGSLATAAVPAAGVTAPTPACPPLPARWEELQGSYAQGRRQRRWQGSTGK